MTLSYRVRRVKPGRKTRQVGLEFVDDGQFGQCPVGDDQGALHALGFEMLAHALSGAGAKGLGGGLPIGAMIAIGPAAHLFKPGDHGSTFGGNPVSAAAGIAVITEIKKRKLELNATKMGEKLIRDLSKIEGVSQVRGKGLLIGIGLAKPWANEISNYLLAKGVLVNAPNPNTIRIAPALILNIKDAEKFIKIFKEVMRNG
mgnify:CR=1 FL=1